MPDTAVEPAPLVEVRLLGLPVAVYQRAAEHGDELTREFQLLLERHTLPSESTPARLLALAAELQAGYGALTESQEQELAAAVERADATVDISYHVPPGVAEAVRRLRSLLEEADRYCQAEKLLTLTTPPETVAFREWFLLEFVRQLDGGRPRPWPGHAPGE
ncbi:MAG: hypothetical protein ACRDZQ_02770 [Acidimicrobiales bacterium]